MIDVERSSDVLHALRRLGVRFAIDDFGTGYSSLNYLQRFPAEAIKIDRSFVRGLREGSDDETIVSAVTHLGHSLTSLVTAEGVERVNQLVRLRELGCDHVQGMLIGPPQTGAGDRSGPAGLARSGPDRQDCRRPVAPVGSPSPLPRRIAMPEAVIVATARSPIGRAMKGSLVDMRPDDLATQMVTAVLDQVPELPRDQIDDLMMGCGQPAGEQGFNVARVVAVLAGLDDVPGVTVNRYCSSSLQTIRMAAHAIKAGEGDAFIAAGVECVSRYGTGAVRHRARTRCSRPSGAAHEAAGRGRPAVVDAAGRAARHLHRHGPDGRERARARGRHPAGDGRVRRAVAAAGGGQRGERLLRAGDRAGDAAGRLGRVAPTTARVPAPPSRSWPS